jgi:molybdopterin-guanine dinucleotide biosynthesis protein A
VIGLWPAAAASEVEAIITGEGKHSMRAFAAMIGARAVQLSSIPANINTPADLLAAEERNHGL